MSNLERRVSALESVVTDGGASALREAARRYLDREQDPERRRMPEALLAAPDEEINAYIAYRELHDARPGHPDVARDAGYFLLLETLYRRVDCEEADGWRRHRDLFHAGLLSASYRSGPPNSRHVNMFHVRIDPTDEQMDRLREIWNARPNAWRRRREAVLEMIRARERALDGGVEPISDPDVASEMVQAALAEAEQAAGWSESLDDLEGCVCWNCLLSRGEIP